MKRIREGHENFALPKSVKNGRGTAMEGKHFSFLHTTFCPFTLNNTGLQVAHIRINTGIAWKPLWEHTFAFHHIIHSAQEAGSQGWWPKAGFPLGTVNDPRNWAERLAECSGDINAATDLLNDMHEQSNTDFIAEILGI